MVLRVAPKEKGPVFELSTNALLLFDPLLLPIFLCYAPRLSQPMDDSWTSTSWNSFLSCPPPFVKNLSPSHGSPRSVVLLRGENLERTNSNGRFCEYYIQGSFFFPIEALNAESFVFGCDFQSEIEFPQDLFLILVNH